MLVRPATLEDVHTYVAFCQSAQARITARGLGQYVPGAHEEYAAAIRSRVEAGSLFVVSEANEIVGFFGLEETPSSWWPADGIAAMYLAGVVVSPAAKGRGVGDFTIDWCVGQARQHGCRYLRLDCHAGNPWLHNYYQARGFTFVSRIPMHPGYEGFLFQRVTSFSALPAV